MALEHPENPTSHRCAAPAAPAAGPSLAVLDAPAAETGRIRSGFAALDDADRERLRRAARRLGLGGPRRAAARVDVPGDFVI